MESTSIYRSLEELPLLLTPAELIPILAVGRNTVYELLRCKKIASIRIGRSIRIPRSALIEFVERTQ